MPFSSFLRSLFGIDKLADKISEISEQYISLRKHIENSEQQFNSTIKKMLSKQPDGSAQRKDFEDRLSNIEQQINIAACKLSHKQSEMSVQQKALGELIESIKKSFDMSYDDIKKSSINSSSRINATSLICGNYLPLLAVINFLNYQKISPDGFGELQILCDKYGSDKGSFFAHAKNHCYTWDAHNYANVYELLFAPIRHQVKYLFECGIGTNNPNLKSNMTTVGRPGASLHVWEEYFKSSLINIYGADIDKDILINSGKIKSFYIDQTNKGIVEAAFKSLPDIKFNIMIDDGLHTAEAAITLFENCISWLDEEGMYFIEDMDYTNLLKLYDYFSTTNFYVNYINMAKLESSDNTLVVIQKNMK